MINFILCLYFLFLFLLLERKLHVARSCDLLLNSKHPEACFAHRGCSILIYLVSKWRRLCFWKETHPWPTEATAVKWKRVWHVSMWSVMPFLSMWKEIFHVHHDSCRKMSGILGVIFLSLVGTWAAFTFSQICFFPYFFFFFSEHEGNKANLQPSPGRARRFNECCLCIFEFQNCALSYTGLH